MQQKRSSYGLKRVESFLILQRDTLNECDIVIDALLGTGLKCAVHDNFANIINAVNNSDKPVISIDIPSGIEANTGQPLGCAVQANLTVTFVGIKQGLTTTAGKQYSGKLVFDDLAIGDAFTSYSSIIRNPG